MQVYLQYNDPTWDNDIRVMIQAFFPGSHISTDISEGAELSVFADFISGEKATDISIKVNTDSKEYQKSSTVVTDGLLNVKERSTSTENNSHKAVRNEFKRLIYDIFSECMGKELPWGTLTGVRPAKIVYGLIEKGEDRDSIADYMKREYYVSDSKINLAYTVAANEKRLIDSIDYKNGYSLYVGIPFCPTTCLYCSFTSYPLCSWKDKVDLYVDALIKEMKASAEMMKGRNLDTFYMGGGTPTTLEPQQMDRVLSCLEENFDLSNLKEYTVEAGRPDSITREKLMVLKKHGARRISINPQTMNDDTLKLIGRQHSVAQIKEAYALARECGFENINMDIIIGLPGEDEAHMRHTLEEIEKLSPDSLTVHSLAIKRASRLNILWEQYKDYSIYNSDNVMEYTQNMATAMGMEPYYMYRQKNMAGNFENVGYSKKGKEGLYNIVIMEEKQDIVACGAGASTKVIFHDENRIERAENVKDVKSYIERIDEMIERKKDLL